MKLKSLEVPMNKIGTKESELRYVLKPVKAGTIGDKEVINFCQTLTQVPRAYLKASLESILQAIAENSRIVRLPPNQLGALNKLKKEI